EPGRFEVARDEVRQHDAEQENVANSVRDKRHSPEHEEHARHGTRCRDEDQYGQGGGESHHASDLTTCLARARHTSHTSPRAGPNRSDSATIALARSTIVGPVGTARMAPRWCASTVPPAPASAPNAAASTTIRPRR